MKDMISNRSMPACTVIPEIGYPDVREAVEWLCGAFGFTVRLRIANHRAQLNVGSCAIVATESDGPPAQQRTMVRVEDVDLHHLQAKRSGATVVSAPANYPYGERQYTALDPAGHTWTFSQSLADVDPTTWGGTSDNL